MKIVILGAGAVGSVVAKDLAGDGAGSRGQEVRLDDVVDVSKVARLPAIPMDLQGLPCLGPFHELGNHGSILGFRMLSRPEHIKIAQRDRFQTKGFRKNL